MPDYVDGKTRWTSREKGKFADGGDAWNALSISNSMEVVLDADGYIIDIWDSVSKKTYDKLGNETTPRDTQYDLGAKAQDPEDMTLAGLDAAIKALKLDYANECRVIRELQRSLGPKRKRLVALSERRAVLSRRSAGLPAYRHRVWHMVITGGGTGSQGVSENSYPRRYRRLHQGVRAFAL